VVVEVVTENRGHAHGQATDHEHARDPVELPSEEGLELEGFLAAFPAWLLGGFWSLLGRTDGGSNALHHLLFDGRSWLRHVIQRSGRRRGGFAASCAREYDDSYHFLDLVDRLPLWLRSALPTVAQPFK
jgi:hypothetical protein